jgi:hypothetical protein
VITKPDGLSVDLYGGPIPFLPIAKTVATDWSIEGILRMSSFPQIRYCVVGFISIDMVKGIGWPLAIHVKPGHPMGAIATITKTNSKVSDLTSRADFSSSQAMVLRPRKDTSEGIIAQQPQETIMRKHEFLHEICRQPRSDAGEPRSRLPSRWGWLQRNETVGCNTLLRDAYALQSAIVLVELRRMNKTCASCANFVCNFEQLWFCIPSPLCGKGVLYDRGYD